MNAWRRLPTTRIARLTLGPLVLVFLSACGGSEEPPDDRRPTLIAPDGREYVLLALGPHEPFYDGSGVLQRVEYDRNGDSRPDQVAHHDGQRLPSIVENDDDFDGATDHWVYYDDDGQVVKIGASRSAQARPDTWIYPQAEDRPVRQEYDDDGDGVINRVDVWVAGRVVEVHVDGDRDGQIDRWQDWSTGRLTSEELDTDNDGAPDRRLLYDASGRVTGIEPIER